MSKIIAFPKSRCAARQSDARAKVNDRKSASAHVPSSVRKLHARSARVEPIWKCSTHGILMSVVVPTCNRPDLLNRCLAALIHQTMDPSRYEIIVVDDAPSNASREVVEKWASHAAVTGPRIFYMPSDGPHGPAAARNRGWHAARGTLIAFTDDDAIPYRDWLVNGLRAFDGVIQAAWGSIVIPLPGLPTDYERDAKALENAEFATANCFCMKRVLEDLDGFDERFRFAWREDADLYFRMLQANVSVSHATEAIVEHPIRPAAWGVSIKQQKKIQFDALLYKKHPVLYREKIHPDPHWDYYLIAASLLFCLAALFAGNAPVAAATGALWSLLTVRLCLQRLRGTVKSLSHVAEMALTSAVVPLMSVFWRIVGALRFRVGFM